MEQISISSLLIFLIILIFISGFFSAAETAMMAINRYRLRHLVRAGNRTAKLVNKLLERPDRLLGVVLIGNTFCNILASAVATIIAERLYGPWGIAIGAAVLTFVVLIFAEMGPKTVAATLAQRIAFLSAWPLEIFLKILYPVVWLGNFIVNNMLRIFRIKVRKHAIEQLTSEELSTLLEEAGENIPDSHQDMLLAILGLEKITVNDILVPRNDIVGIDLEDEWEKILKQLSLSTHNRLPVYEEDINNIKGILNVRVALNLVTEHKLKKETLLSICEEVYFVPESAKLTTQLIHFRTNKRRMGIVVDEYGDVLGLITLADMLEEIVGEFTTNITTTYKGIQPQPDGSYLVSGNMNIRDLNRLMDWAFDTTGPKTLNGLILEYLEMIPQPGICLRISGYPIEIIKVTENSVAIARIFLK